MKPGTEMEYKQGQTTLAIVDKNNGPLYSPCKKVSSSGSSKKLIVKVVLGLLTLALLTLALIVAATLIAVYLGGRITKEAVKESFFTFHMPDGTSLKEKITVAGAEEDITVLGQDTRTIYDYSKGFMVTRTKEDGRKPVCYISTFDRTQLSAPAVGEDQSMMDSNVTALLPEIDYYVQKDQVGDPEIVSPRSRDMCNGLPVYWMSRSLKSSGAGTETRRYKRRCERRCGLQCSCCPRDCKVECRIKCSW